MDSLKKNKMNTLHGKWIETAKNVEKLVVLAATQLAKQGGQLGIETTKVESHSVNPFFGRTLKNCTTPPMQWEYKDAAGGICDFVAYTPLNTKGMYLEVWPTRSDDHECESVVTFIPAGTVLIMPRETIVAAGLVSSTCMNRHMMLMLERNNVSATQTENIVAREIDGEKHKHNQDLLLKDANDIIFKGERGKNNDDSRKHELNMRVLTQPPVTYLRDGYSESGIEVFARGTHEGTQVPSIDLSNWKDPEDSHVLVSRKMIFPEPTVGKRVSLDPWVQKRISKGRFMYKSVPEGEITKEQVAAFVEQERTAFPDGVPAIYYPSSNEEKGSVRKPKKDKVLGRKRKGEKAPASRRKKQKRNKIEELFIDSSSDEGRVEGGEDNS
mmetsp:Transcript_6304/g.17772  ORF Transcript_6304/g.17772 Transcript_6304/m.17772 type:complete len:383 (+) Transcript_6304:613-1761(+)